MVYKWTMLFWGTLSESDCGHEYFGWTLGLNFRNFRARILTHERTAWKSHNKRNVAPCRCRVRACPHSLPHRHQRRRPPPHHPCSPTVISIISPTLSSTLALYERSQCQWDLRAVIYFVLHLQPSIDSPLLLPGRPSLNPRTYLKSSIDYIIITLLPI